MHRTAEAAPVLPRKAQLPRLRLCTFTGKVLVFSGAAYLLFIVLANHDRTNREKAMTVGSTIALGVGIGAALGLAMDNITLGVGMGAALGVAIGVALDNERRKRAEDDKDK